MPKPKFRRAPITALCPTQLTVGMLEVEVKRKRLAALSPEDLEAFLEAHPMPVVIGPAGKLYITDHHHLARAALAAKIDQACFRGRSRFLLAEIRRFLGADGQELVGASARSTRRAASLLLHTERVWTKWSTIPTGPSQVSCAMRGDS